MGCPSASHPTPTPINERKQKRKTSSHPLVHGEAPPWGGGLGAAADTGLRVLTVPPPAPP